MTSRYTLFGTVRSGPTYKVALALSLMGEPYQFRTVDMASGEHKSPSYLRLNRFGQVPTLVDETMGRSICQSAAILDYLTAQSGRFVGRTPEERVQANEWMYWDFDRLAPHLYRARAAALGFREVDPATLRLHHVEGQAALGVLDQHLAGREWLVGRSPTIADIDIYGVVAFAGDGGFDLTPFASVSAWVHRMRTLPGFIERAG